MNNRVNINPRESGMALVFAIGLLALLLMIGMAFVGNAVNARKAAENNSARTQARMLAMSAVSRASASIMIYSHQYGLENEREVPEHFNHLYSFDKSETFTDGLLKKDKSSSLMILPVSGGGVSSTLAMAFNAPFVSTKDSSKWQGNWVFFRDGTSSNRIIGRAAWQVIGSSAQILAPVFMRGHLTDIDLADENFKASERRWGREIDEVYLDQSRAIYENIPEVMAVTGGKLPAITDYEQIFNALNIEENSVLQRWAEKWFFPDSNEKSNAGEPSMIVAESFAYNSRSFMRFNISELCQGQYASEPGGDPEHTSWDKAYKVSATSDPWYARLGIDTNGTNKDLANSERAIIRLSTDAQLLDYNFDYEMVVSSNADTDYSGLPLLRRIGNTPGTFADLGALRKQITANFNDYCDKDSVPTSDVAADKWLTGMWSSDPKYEDATAFVDPVYTGNELSPYLYELGMHFGIVSSDDTTSDVMAVKQADGDNVGKFLVQVQIKAAPILKLCNMYPFTLANTSFNELRGYVDFGQMDVNFKFQKVILKDVEFRYSVTDNSVEPAQKVQKSFTCDVVLDQLNPDTLSTGNLDILTNLFTFKGRNWQRAAAVAAGESTDVQPMIFTGTELDNQPYPVKYAKSTDEDFWQKLANDPVLSGNTLAFSFDLTTAGIFDADSGTWKNGVKLENINSSNGGTETDFLTALKGDAAITEPVVAKQPEKMNIQAIKISEIAYTPQRIVLTGKPVDTTANESGLDYVKAFDQLKWTFTAGNEKVLSLLATDPGSGPVFAGFALSGIRNYDPRQNLNKGDWFAPNAEVVELTDFTLPEAKLNEAAAAPEKQNAFFNLNSVNYIAADGSGDTSPENQGTVSDKDWEIEKEPAYRAVAGASPLRLSTAVIRNAPMMSPWEIGFIHRGVKWQTINIKNSSTNSGMMSQNVDDAGVPEWTNAGSSYSEGDGLILEQIKMTDQVRTYGKININLLHPGHQDYRDEDKNIIRALFQNIEYDEDPLSFIAESTRDASGKFPAVTSDFRIDKAMADTIADNFVADSSRPRNYNHRAAFLNFTGSSDTQCLERGFHPTIESIQDTDAAQEEIIGKTVNLLDASTSSPNRIIVAIVAQSIRDVEGEQVRVAPADSGYISGSVDSDGVATKNCSIGSFDMYEHGEDDTKNIYFDEITGEVKMVVTFRFDTSKQRLFIEKIDYL